MQSARHGGRTGWPAGLMQDDCRELFAWFASRPDAREALDKALATDTERRRDRQCFIDPAGLLAVDYRRG